MTTSMSIQEACAAAGKDGHVVYIQHNIRYLVDTDEEGNFILKGNGNEGMQTLDWYATHGWAVVAPELEAKGPQTLRRYESHGQDVLCVSTSDNALRNVIARASSEHWAQHIATVLQEWEEQ